MTRVSLTKILKLHMYAFLHVFIQFIYALFFQVDAVSRCPWKNGFLRLSCLLGTLFKVKTQSKHTQASIHAKCKSALIIYTVSVAWRTISS